MSLQRHRTARQRRQESGMALAIVLGSVTLFVVLAAMLITSTRTTAIVSKVNVDRSFGRYAAESALSYAEWMLLNDRRRYGNNRRLGVPTPEREALGDVEEPWLADGRLHHVRIGDDVLAEIRVVDAASGWDFSNARSIQAVRSQLTQDAYDDVERQEVINEYFDILLDYIDPGDEHRNLGLEREDWEDQGLENFPRNAALVFREEAYWLPGVEKLLPRLATESTGLLPQDLLRIIAPPRLQNISLKPAFFSSSPEMIKLTARLSSDELEQALACRDQWIDNQQALADCLGPLYSRLNASMLLTESGVYTIEVQAGYEGAEITRRLVATIDLRTMPAKYLQYWQRVIF